jgi:hypothetical protein
MLPVVLISAGIYGIIDKYDGFPERYPNLAEFNQEQLSNILRKIVLINLMLATAMSVLWALKDTLDGVLIGDSFANKRQPSWMFWQRR